MPDTASRNHFGTVSAFGNVLLIISSLSVGWLSNFCYCFPSCTISFPGLYFLSPWWIFGIFYVLSIKYSVGLYKTFSLWLFLYCSLNSSMSFINALQRLHMHRPITLLIDILTGPFKDFLETGIPLIMTHPFVKRHFQAKARALAPLSTPGNCWTSDGFDRTMDLLAMFRGFGAMALGSW